MVFRVYCGVAVVLAVCAGVQTWRTYADPRAFGGADPILPYNADFLAAAALYEDVVVDGYGIRNFKFSACTFAVPDVATYFAVRAVTGSVRTALVPWQFVLFALLVTAGGFAGASCLPPDARRWVWPGVLMWAAGYLAYTCGDFLTGHSRDLLLPAWHNGAQVCGFVALGLTARFTRASTRRTRAGLVLGLFGVSAAAAFSDRLYGLYFAAPAVAALAAVRLLIRPAGGRVPPVTWTRWAVVAAAVGAGCGVGLFGLRLTETPGTGPDPLAAYWAGPETGNLAGRLANLGRVLVAEAAAGNVLILAAAVWAVAGGGLALYTIGRRGGAGSADGLVFYQVYGMAAWVVTSGVFVVSLTGRTYLDGDPAPWGLFGRYFAGPLGAAAFGGPVWLAAAQTAPWRLVRAVALAVPVAAAGGLLLATTATPRLPGRDLLDPYPDFVRDTDAACVRHGLTDGLGGYWESKPVTLLSKAGVRLRPVGTAPHLPRRVQPFVWLSNSEWYWPPPGGPTAGRDYQFVLAAGVPADTPDGVDIPEAAAVAGFGPPADRVPIGRLRLLVYGRPQDGRLRDYADHDEAMVNRKYRNHPRGPTRFVGASFFSPAGATADGDRLVAAEGLTPAGYMAAGPFLTLARTGPHVATFRVEAAGVPARDASVDVYATDRATRIERLVAIAPIPPNHGGDIRVGFAVTGDMLDDLVQFRTHYPGRGHLDVRF